MKINIAANSDDVESDVRLVWLTGCALFTSVSPLQSTFSRSSRPTEETHRRERSDSMKSRTTENRYKTARKGESRK